MKIPQTRVQKVKAGLHCTQCFTILIGGILSLVVLTEPGGLGGEVGYFFGLCFLTIPAIIYQIMVPMWTRAWRLNNVYAFAVVDCLFTVLWFSAFIAVAVWRSDGLNKGKSSDNAGDDSDKKKASNGSCSHFAYGSASKCETANATVIFGVITWLLFCNTAALSFRTVFDFKRTGVAPISRIQEHGHPEDVDAAKDTWSTNIDELDLRQTDSYEGDHHDPRRSYGQVTDDFAQAGLLNSSQVSPHEDPFQDTHSLYNQTEHNVQPARPLSYQFSEVSSIAPSVYSSKSSHTVGMPSPIQHVPHMASGPNSYQHMSGRRVDYPEGNYSSVSDY